MFLSTVSRRLPACHLPACHLPACHLPACHLQYTFLLTNQLESQRLFFEEKVKVATEEMQQEVRSSADECLLSVPFMTTIGGLTMHSLVFS